MFTNNLYNIFYIKTLLDTQLIAALFFGYIDHVIIVTIVIIEKHFMMLLI